MEKCASLSQMLERALCVAGQVSLTSKLMREGRGEGKTVYEPVHLQSQNIRCVVHHSLREGIGVTQSTHLQRLLRVVSAIGILSKEGVVATH